MQGIQRLALTQLPRVAARASCKVTPHVQVAYTSSVYAVKARSMSAHPKASGM
jgi:hypothetical protein